MKIIETIVKTKAQIRTWRNVVESYATIGFVPTMGALHEGHLSLIKRSVKENDKTVVSIFVNPTQFAPNEDLSNYPRTFESDCELCQKAGVDLIFCPSSKEMYKENFSTFVNMSDTELTSDLCGKSRPTHFRGVCTVVNKLFNIVKPDYAYFGQKDAQQLAVIKRMVRDLDLDVKIVSCPIVRERDGLAKSSRNVYLNTDERNAALVLSRVLFEGERLFLSGEKDVKIIINAIKRLCESEPLAKIDYIEIVNPDTMQRLTEIRTNALIAIAVYVGNTRLIDNIVLN
ncbi:MAG: pantoate--beta-alanine ligase [Oscillospiraceae bacterium]|nr:pantoate--beta-alanine ligase [Oscillospiraceae bacterium]